MNSLLPELRYAFYLTVHPFKGFWEIRHEKQGSVRTSVLLMLLFILTSVSNGLYNGFLFNQNGGIHFNVWQHIAVVLLVYFLWCIANWCLTSLFDGEGTFKDICKFTSYALLPLSLVQLILIPLSHAMSLQESSFYMMILNIGIIWTGLLLFIGMLVTHQYTVLKAALIAVVTLLGMCVIIYIMLLFFNLIQQIIGFVITFWRELSLRMS